MLDSSGQRDAFAKYLEISLVFLPNCEHVGAMRSHLEPARWYHSDPRRATICLPVWNNFSGCYCTMLLPSRCSPTSCINHGVIVFHTGPFMPPFARWMETNIAVTSDASSDVGPIKMVLPTPSFDRSSCMAALLACEYDRWLRQISTKFLSRVLRSLFRLILLIRSSFSYTNSINILSIWNKSFLFVLISIYSVRLICYFEYLILRFN